MLHDLDRARKAPLFGFRAAGTLCRMKHAFRPFLAPLALGLLAVPVLLAASSGPASRDGDPALEESMQTLQAGVKGLDKALEKSETERALGLVADMQKAAHAAKGATPTKAGEITDAAAKAKFVTGYRLQMIQLERGLLDVEAALLEGKVADAKKALDTHVKPHKKAGHDAYKD
jgi:soluble cytochrome b562